MVSIDMPDMRQPGSPDTAADTRQSTEILTNFHEVSHLILLRIVNLCLEMSSNFKHYLGYVVEEFFELGHTTKSRCFRR